MKTLLEYLRLFLYRWFGYDPKAQGEWKPITYFRARLYDLKPKPFWKGGAPDSPFLVKTKDGQAIQSSAYTDKTIYERFEQSFTYPVDSKAIGTFESPRP